VHKKGDFINYKPDGWSDGVNWADSQYNYAKSGKFVVVKCPEITFAEAETYDHRQPWKDDFDYEIVATRPAQGEYDIRIFENNPGASNQNSISGAKAIKIRDYLLKWGCSNMSLGTHDTSFTFSLWDAVRSENFWEVPFIGLKVSFALNSYSSSTGIASIAVTATDGQWGIMTEEQISQQIESKIGRQGGTLTDSSYPVFTFTIERSNVLTKFREDVKRKIEQVYTRHRFSISSADVDTIISNGGMMTLTRAQVLAKLKDKMSD
jgi:hypothetical protein